VTGPAGRRPFPKLVSDLAALSGGDFVAKLLGFVAFAWLARKLSAADYGAVELAVTLEVFFCRVVDAGLGVIGVRELAKGSDGAERLIVEVPLLRLTLALLAVPAMVLGSRWIAQPAPPAALIWPFALALLPFALTQQWVAQAREKMAGFALGQTLRSLVFALLVLFAVAKGEHLARVGAAELLAATAAMVYFALHLRRSPAHPRFAIEPARLLRLLRSSTPVGLAFVVWGVYQLAPVALVARLVGGDETAWIGADMRLIGSLLVLSALYHFNLFPEISQRLQRDPEGFRRLIDASLRVIAWGSACGALLLTVTAALLLRVGFGPPFVAAAPALAVLAWVVPVTMVGGHARWALVASGHQRSLLVAQVVGALAMLIAGVMLTPSFRSVGAAAAMLVASLLVALTALLLAHRALDCFPGALGLVAPAAASVLALAAARWLPFATPARGAAAVALFVLAALPFVRRLRTDIGTLAAAKGHH